MDGVELWMLRTEVVSIYQFCRILSNHIPFIVEFGDALPELRFNTFCFLLTVFFHSFCFR